MSRNERGRKRKRRAAAKKAGMIVLILIGLAFASPVLRGKEK